jgi:DNA-binding NarL/FixJ family response regulator
MVPKSKTDDRGRIRVAVVEENLTARRRLQRIINRSKGMRCVAAYQSHLLALKEIKSAKPDVVITDLAITGMDAGEFLSKLRTAFPSAKVIVRTEREDYASVFRALRSVALGYVLKSEPLCSVVDDIRSVMNGGSPMTARITRIVVVSIQQGKARSKNSLPLTFREIQILSSAAIGLKVREIANQYSISEATVRAHIRKIYIKLQVNTRAEAVLKFLESELC